MNNPLSTIMQPNNSQQIQQILKLVQQSGLSPKALFYQQAKAKGVDPNSILNMLK